MLENIEQVKALVLELLQKRKLLSLLGSKRSRRVRHDIICLRFLEHYLLTYHGERLREELATEIAEVRGQTLGKQAESLVSSDPKIQLAALLIGIEQ